ncbi:LOB domain-containing protein 1-like [Primulina huaijiensis]|uniref:LOB domain-containing protein 1-like n=1 Tax=Primulina huaijiensis TaxID=1492673 RepID=UPI003CC6F4D6
MEYSENTTSPTSSAAAVVVSVAAAGGYPSSISPTHSPLSPSAASPPPPHVILSPCAACKILRRRCVENCILAPYFPPDQPLKFTIAHRVFGASNIIKLLRDLPEAQRADAVTSMVYEANARLRDPVYGCAGSICQLQKQISELQGELAKAQAEIMNMQCQNSKLFEIICKKMATHDDLDQETNHNLAQELMFPYDEINNSQIFLDENILGVAWEPLWT